MKNNHNQRLLLTLLFTTQIAVNTFGMENNHTKNNTLETYLEELDFYDAPEIWGLFYGFY